MTHLIHWLLLLISSAAAVHADFYPPPCDSPVYCAPGPNSLLHVVQMAGLFPDSKTFVDMPMKYDEDQVLAAFNYMMQVIMRTPKFYRPFCAQHLYNTFPKYYSHRPQLTVPPTTILRIFSTIKVLCSKKSDKI